MDSGLKESGVTRIPAGKNKTLGTEYCKHGLYLIDPLDIFK